MVHFGLIKNADNYLSFIAMQGEAIHRTGTLEVQVKIENNEPIEVKIVGNAIITFSTDLVLE